MSGAALTVFSLLVIAVAWVYWVLRDKRNPLAFSYSREFRAFFGLGSKIALLVGVILFISAPVGFSWIGIGSIHLPTNFVPGFPLSEKWLYYGVVAATYAIGALGLNLLIGNSGQVSLGHSAFIAVGAYSTGYFGVDLPKSLGIEMPSIVWLACAILMGALIGAIIGPFALRLRGNYLAMVSIMFVFLATHIAKNWESFTNGDSPRTDLPPFKMTFWPGKSILFKDGSESNFFDVFFPSTNAAYFWLCWTFVAIGCVVARNLLRTRQGRALMAVRDRDVSAELIGVHQLSTKTRAFALSGGFAAASGALYASFVSGAQPSDFTLTFSITFIEMIVIGGVGSVLGSVLGAVAMAFTRALILSPSGTLTRLPFIQKDSLSKGISQEQLAELVFGALLIVFLVYFPTGLSGFYGRLKRYVQNWPLPDN